MERVGKMNRNVNFIRDLPTDELRQPAEAVFLDSYPAEDDIRGWLKLKSKDFMFGNIARNALAEIDRLDALVLKLQTRADYMDARYNDLVNFRKKHG